ncbi:MAG: RdgB/HAM1 family non-canonical purine NTP pyrophosphatase [Oxalobacteraceae bacterium]
MRSDLVIASNNPGKLAEFSRLLGPLGYRVRPQSDLGIGEAEEPHPTFIENALAKARHASRASGLPALADDSGICVPALGGAPGVQSARYAGEPKSDDANNAKLVQALSSHNDKSAYYYCVLVFVRHAEDPQPVIAEGRWQGELIAQPRGEGGFGYDPHFLLPALGKTAAELSAEQKNQLSHRGQALRALMAKLS